MSFWLICAYIIVGAIALCFLIPLLALFVAIATGVLFAISLGALSLWEYAVRKGRAFFTPKPQHNPLGLTVLGSRIA
jgi:hypothetical protein